MADTYGATHYTGLAVRLANGTEALVADSLGYVTSAALLKARIIAKLTNSGIVSKLTQAGLLSLLTNSGIMSELTSSGLLNKITLSGLMAKITSTAVLAELTSSAMLSKITLSGIMAKITSSAILAELTNSGMLSVLTASGLRSKLTGAITAAEMVASATDNIRKKGDLSVAMNASGRATLNTPGVVAEFMNVTVFNDNVMYQGTNNAATSAVMLKFRIISADAAHAGELTASAMLANSGLVVSGGYDYQVV